MTRSIVTVIVLSLFGLLVHVQPIVGNEQQDAKKSFIEVTTDVLEELVVNHRQGSISMRIDGKNYFYYVALESDVERTLATSAVLSDIRSSRKLKLKYETYGLHCRVVNLQLFYDPPTNDMPK